jgi:thiamine biosynthesis protein ThiS
MVQDVIVNGEPHRVERGSTVADLLRSLGLEASQVAVERNREIVPRTQHADTSLTPGDRLEIVTFVGGG